MNLTPIIMDLKAKIDELWINYSRLEAEKEAIHNMMKNIKRKIAKYETVLKHAEEIESLPEEKEKV